MFRKIALGAAALGLFMPAMAQITIGSNEMPHADDHLHRTRAVTNPFISYGATGPNHNWTFTSLAANTEDSVLYQSVASTNLVYALVYADVGFNTNRANVARAGADISFNGLLPIANPYSFTYRSSSIYKTVGFGAELSGIPVPITFDQQDVIYDLPLHYGDAGSSSSAWHLSLPTLAYYGYAQDRANEVDGWGTITTPAGSFNVLRVKTTLIGVDTVNIDGLGIGFTIDRPIAREYKWLATGYRVPILQINTSEIFGTEVVTDIWFYDEPHTITVLPPIPALCPGSTFALQYHATGVFNVAGFLIPANVFTAQLSSATGDFTSPTNIGSVTATGSGVINVTIPPGTAPGSGYRIRVVSNSPVFIGPDNGVDLAIGVAPIAQVQAGGPTTFCAGGSVTLTASGGDSYQWSLDGSPVPGATGTSMLADAPGAYTVTATNGCGSNTSPAVNVLVNDPPEHMLTSLSYSTCDGDPVMISAVDLSGQSNLSYQWFLDGAALPGGTNVDVTTVTPGTYSLEVSNTLTGCVFTTDTASLLVEAVPMPSVNAVGSTTFCAGDSVMLDAGSWPGYSLQWNLDGADIAGETGTQLLAFTPGDYAVTITSAMGCSATSTPAVSVTVNTPPALPVIGQSTDTLFVPGGSTYEWYLDGTLIAGATDSSLIATTSGDYSVLVTDADGCSSLSDPYTYIATGLHVNGSLSAQALPNPNDGSFILVVPSGTSERFEITDAAGRLVIQGALSGVRTLVDLGACGSGVYLLRVMRMTGMANARVVVR